MKSNDNILNNLLEKIMFNEKDFNEFKIIISKLYNSEEDSRLLKETIVRTRVRILEELKDLFPFYMNQISKKQSIEKFGNIEQDSDSVNELKNKNKFLTEIACRLENIFKKLTT